VDLPAFDAQIPLLSLPGVFRTTPESVPATIPYLAPPPELQAAWRSRLGGVPGRRVGIAWQGSRVHRGDRDRSVALAAFRPLAEVNGVRLVSLQKGPGLEQLPALQAAWSVLDIGGQTSDDWAEMAAVVANLDLVVTVDTALAHLAGALGVPCWIALPFAPDWRWLLDRADCSWYRTVRLFRQNRPGAWQNVFEEIGVALRESTSSVIGPTAFTAASQEPWLQVQGSRDLGGWLASEGISLAFTTYQTGKLLLLGHRDDGSLSIFERTFNRCMGLTVSSSEFWLSSLYQIWRFVNVLQPGKAHEGYDALFVPRTGHTTGDLDVHDLAVEASGRLVFVNT
jgi:hypothetical protein